MWTWAVWWCWLLEDEGQTVLLQTWEEAFPVSSVTHAGFWTKDNPVLPVIYFCLFQLSPPPALHQPSTNIPTPGSNPAVVMSPVWELCSKGYVITPAYLLADSLWLFGVAISCFPSPHVRPISHSRLRLMGFDAASWKRWMVLFQHCSLATASSSLSHCFSPSHLSSLAVDIIPPPHRFPSFPLAH